MMGAVTYPESLVAEEIHNHFVPVQVNTQEDAGKPLVERFRQTWTPDVRILAADGFELSRWNGYLPPFEFVPQLLAARAEARLREGANEEAAGIYEEVLRRFPTSRVAPEAQYFLGVARYKASHEGGDLMGAWHQLRTKYPDSVWRLKQTFAEK